MNPDVLKDLIQRYPAAKMTSVEQPLSSADFDAQQHKHLSRQALGGAIGIIKNPDGKVVLVRRSGMHAGWALPGGTVEAGEDFSTAFAREVGEEIGISVTDVELREVERKTFTSPIRDALDFTLCVFAARMVHQVLPAPTADALSEGLTVALFDMDDIPAEMILGDREKLLRYSAIP